MDPIVVSPRVTIPADAISWRAVRAQGPGGQNVNKVATKVVLSLSMSKIVGMSDAARRRLADAGANRLDADGRLLVSCEETRHQARNLDIARERMRQIVAASLPAPKRRVATKPSRAAKRRRMDSKRKTSEKKRDRRYRGD